MTKAELKRQLTVGRKLVCTANIRGACNYPRTVKAVRSNSAILLTEKGQESELGLGAGITVEATDGGFRMLREGQLMAAYLFA